VGKILVLVLAVVALIVGSTIVDSLLDYLDVTGGWFASLVWLLVVGLGTGWALVGRKAPIGDAILTSFTLLVIGAVCVWGLDALLRSVFGIDAVHGLFRIIGADGSGSLAASGVRVSVFAVLSSITGFLAMIVVSFFSDR
jgi:hypothetical protein